MEHRLHWYAHSSNDRTYIASLPKRKSQKVGIIYRDTLKDAYVWCFLLEKWQELPSAHVKPLFGCYPLDPPVTEIMETHALTYCKNRVEEAYIDWCYRVLPSAVLQTRAERPPAKPVLNGYSSTAVARDQRVIARAARNHIPRDTDWLVEAMVRWRRATGGDPQKLYDKHARR